MTTYLTSGLLGALLVLAPVLSHASADVRTEPTPVQDERSESTDKAWRWGGFLEADLGVLIMSAGTGLFAGPSYGPFRAAVGFYRFDSPFKAIGGVPDGFELKVNWLLSADVAYFIAQDRPRGAYVRLAYQEKEQRVLNLGNGARAYLRSRLAGPEVGYLWSFASSVYLAPRLGALYYLRSPQPEGRPLLVGGQEYANARHKDWDLFATLGVGVNF